MDAMSEAIEYEEHVRRSADVKVTKDTDTFGGPNKWHLHVKDADGKWIQVQWVDAIKAERIVGKDLPRYSEESTVTRHE